MFNWDSSSGACLMIVSLTPLLLVGDAYSLFTPLTQTAWIRCDELSHYIWSPSPPHQLRRHSTACNSRSALSECWLAARFAAFTSHTNQLVFKLPTAIETKGSRKKKPLGVIRLFTAPFMVLWLTWCSPEMSLKMLCWQAGDYEIGVPEIVWLHSGTLEVSNYKIFSVSSVVTVPFSSFWLAASASLITPICSYLSLACMLSPLLLSPCVF